MSIFTKLITLFRGTAHEAGAAVVDANALKILDQEIRDADNALGRARDDLATLVAKRRMIEKELQNLSETNEQLEPIATEIKTLLKKEADIRKIASGYTTAEADHAFWYDLLAEVRGAFANDAVWITDLEPLNGYNPLADKKVDPKAGEPKSMIKTDFFSSAYGQPSLLTITPETPSGKGKNAPAASVTDANAIRLRGFWRENPSGQNVVSEVLKKIRDNPRAFTFTLPDKDGKPVNLKDEQILKVTAFAAGGGGELGFPFELTLPLAREVAVK